LWGRKNPVSKSRRRPGFRETGKKFPRPLLKIE